MIGWLITEKIISTKKGEPMEFITFEDETGPYDVPLFPKTYRRYCYLLATNQVYVVAGRVEEPFSAVPLPVRVLWLLTTRNVGIDCEPIEEVVG